MKKIAAIQIASGSNVNSNLNEIAQQISTAVKNKAQLVVLPESFAMMGLHDSDQLKIAEPEGVGPIQDFISNQAKKNKVWIIAGTIPLKLETEHPKYNDKIYAACLIYNEKGEQVSRYNKIHLFDVHIEASNETYDESATFEMGDNIAVIETPFGKIGLAICFDLRFPELFRNLVLKGAEIIVIPSAFTSVTGKAHWEILMRARAIENLCYVIAASQGGHHANGRETYGDSMIVDPWGTILDRLPQGSGYAIADIELEKLYRIRNSFPVLENRKLSYLLSEHKLKSEN